MTRPAWLLPLVLLLSGVAHGQTITTYAGNGTLGYCGDGGPATSACTGGPRGFVLIPGGGLLISETNDRVRKVDAAGIITTVAGSETGGYCGDGGPATSACLSGPTGMTFDSAGNLFIIEAYNNRLRRVDTAGIITTVAGNGTRGFCGDGGAATSACLAYPHDVGINAAGTLFIVDLHNHRIRQVDTGGTITTVAGNGTEGFCGDGGLATNACLNGPDSVAVDTAGNLFIADRWNHRIRKVTATTGVITTVAGNGTPDYCGDGGLATNACLHDPTGVAVDAAGNLFIADLYNWRIRKVDTEGIITSVAGNGTQGFCGDSGPATSACLDGAAHVKVNATRELYLADYWNNRTRRVGLPDSVTVLVVTPNPSIQGEPVTVQAAVGTSNGVPAGYVQFRDGSAVVARVPLAAGLASFVTSSLSLGTHVLTAFYEGSSDHSPSESAPVTLNTIPDAIPPVVLVLRPNASGEKVFGGIPFLIEWTGSDRGILDWAQVAVSLDAGASYAPVPGCEALAGTARTCQWLPPTTPGVKGRIKVTMGDRAGNVAADESDALFTIATGTPLVTVSTPNTEVTWAVGSTQVIKWSHNLGAGSYATVEVSRDAGQNWTALAPPIKHTSSSSGSYNWAVTGPSTTAALIRVTATSLPMATDTSNVDFIVWSPFINIATPNLPWLGYGYGTRQRIDWATNLGPLDKVTLRLSTDGGATFSHVLGTNLTASTKYANVTIPTLTAPVSTARVRAEWNVNTAVAGTSPINFLVEPPFVRLRSPNGPQHPWKPGTSQTIRWTSNLGAAENVMINLSLDGGLTYPVVLVGSTKDDGAHAVTVQAAWATPQARVRVSWVTNPGIADVSNQSFPIQ